MLSTTATDSSVLAAVHAAHERDMTVVPPGVVRETDVLICVPHDRAARAREVHTLVLNCLCDGMDAQLFGEQEIS